LQQLFRQTSQTKSTTVSTWRTSRISMIFAG
jgi:hypothetical protein